MKLGGRRPWNHLILPFLLGVLICGRVVPHGHAVAQVACGPEGRSEERAEANSDSEHGPAEDPGHHHDHGTRHDAEHDTCPYCFSCVAEVPTIAFVLGPDRTRWTPGDSPITEPDPAEFPSAIRPRAPPRLT
jgi:hypothetical protein